MAAKFQPIHYFDTIEDYARYAKGLEAKLGMESAARQSRDFCEFSFEETVNHAIDGWPTGKAYMQKVHDLIKSGNFFTPLPTYTLDVAGAYPIAAIAAAGDQFCMIEPRRDLNSRKKVLTFKVNLGMNCNWTSEQVHNYGGALLAWMDRLETSGFSVEVDGYIHSTSCDSSKAKSHTLRTFFGIKKAGQPFDLNRLGFALVHTGPLRRFEFRLVEQYPELWNNGFAHSYGRSTVMTKEYRALYGHENEDAIWLVGRDTALNQRCTEAKGALAVLKEQIKVGCEEAGIELDVDEMIAGE